MVSMPGPGPKPPITPQPSLPLQAEKGSVAPPDQTVADVAKKGFEAQRNQPSPDSLDQREVTQIKTPLWKAILNAIMALFQRIFNLFTSAKPPETKSAPANQNEDDKFVEVIDDGEEEFFEVEAPQSFMDRWPEYRREALAAFKPGQSTPPAAQIPVEAKGFPQIGNSCYIASSIQMLRSFKLLDEQILSGQPLQKRKSENERQFKERVNLRDALKGLVAAIDAGKYTDTQSAARKLREILFFSSLNTGQFPKTVRKFGFTMSGEAEQWDSADAIGMILNALDHPLQFDKTRTFLDSTGKLTTLPMGQDQGYPVLKLELIKSPKAMNFAERCKEQYHAKNVDNKTYKKEMVHGHADIRDFPKLDSYGNVIYAKDSQGNKIPEKDEKGNIKIDWKPAKGGAPMSFNEDITIHGSPPALLPVNLSRFANVGEKVMTTVEFDDVIDLNHLFTDGSKDAFYSVVGFTVHHGPSLDGGHYTAYRLDSDNKWRCYNDASVTEANLNQVGSAMGQACSLILKKVG